jgi:hypothetical protein
LTACPRRAGRRSVISSPWPVRILQACAPLLARDLGSGWAGSPAPTPVVLIGEVADGGRVSAQRHHPHHAQQAEPDIGVNMCLSGRIAPPSEHGDAHGRKTRPPTEHNHGSRPSRPTHAARLDPAAQPEEPQTSQAPQTTQEHPDGGARGCPIRGIAPWAACRRRHRLELPPVTDAIDRAYECRWRSRQVALGVGGVADRSDTRGRWRRRQERGQGARPGNAARA